MRLSFCHGSSLALVPTLDHAEEVSECSLDLLPTGYQFAVDRNHRVFFDHRRELGAESANRFQHFQRPLHSESPCANQYRPTDGQRFLLDELILMSNNSAVLLDQILSRLNDRFWGVGRECYEEGLVRIDSSDREGER